jgi:hypothetical protein
VVSIHEGNHFAHCHSDRFLDGFAFAQAETSAITEDWVEGNKLLTLASVPSALPSSETMISYDNEDVLQAFECISQSEMFNKWAKDQSSFFCPID